MSLLSDKEIASMVDTVLDLANAKLLAIATPGALQPNGDPGEQTTVWAGEVPCQLERAEKVNEAAGEERRTITTTLHVYDTVAPAVEIAGADHNATTVVILDETRAPAITRRWTVKGVSKETEHTLDGITLELHKEEAP